MSNPVPAWLTFALSREDVRSPTWRRLAGMLEARIDELRQTNDSPTHGPEHTALIRGGIRELQRILSLADNASDSAAADPAYMYGVSHQEGQPWPINQTTTL
jgi:hypothetical protein